MQTLKKGGEEMTLEKAIEIQDLCVRGHELDGSPDLCEAMKLGIEALRYIRYNDNCPGVSIRLLLQGETEEGSDG